MPLPFRNQVNTEDSNEDSLPDYFTPISAQQDDELPDYFTPVQAKAKPSVFSRAVGYLAHPSPFDITKTFDTARPAPKPDIDRTSWDKRPDGSDKGDGFLGVLKTPKGVVTEYSIADSESLKDEKGNYLDYPTLVPTLTKDEVRQVLDAAANGKDVPDSIKAKAEAHALKRKQQGLPLFATPGEERTDIHPDLERVPEYDPNKHAKVDSPIIDAAKTYGRRFISGPSKEEVEGRELAGPGFMEVPGAKKSADYIRQKGMNTGNYWGGFAGSIVGDIIEAGASGFDPRTAGVEHPPVKQAGWMGKSTEAAPYETARLYDEAVASGYSDTAAKKAAGLSVRQPVRAAEISKKTPIAATPETPIRQPVTPALEAKPTPEEAVKTLTQEQPVKKPFVNPFEKPKLEEVKPTAVYKGTQPGIEDIPETPLFNIVGGPNHGDTVSAQTLEKMGIKVPSIKEEGLVGQEGEVNTPRLAGFTNSGNGIGYIQFDTRNGRVPTVDEIRSMFPNESDLTIQKFKANILRPDIARFRIDADKYDPKVIARMEQSLGGNFTDWNAPVKPTEDALYNIAREKFNMGKDLPEPTTEAEAENISAIKAWRASGPKSAAKAQNLPEYFKSVEEVKPETEVPKIEPQQQDLVSRTVAKLQDTRAAAKERIRQRGTFSGTKLSSGLPTDDLADFAIIGSTHIAEGAVKFADWSVKMIEELGESVKPYLAQIFKESQAKSEEAKLSGARKLFNSLIETRGARTEQGEMYSAERAERLAKFSNVKEGGILGAVKKLGTLKGEFEKATPAAPVDLDELELAHLATTIQSLPDRYEQARGITGLFKQLKGEEIPQGSELAVFDKVFKKYFGQVSGPGASGKFDLTQYEKYGIKPEDFPKSFQQAGEFARSGRSPNKFLSVLSKSANTMKSMENAISLAAPLRHGAGLAARKEFYPAFADMFRFFGNKEYYSSAMKALEERPNAELARSSGLFISKVGSWQQSEEEFLKSYAGNIPIVKNVVGASQRAYMGFLNKLRSDVFDSMTARAKELGYKTSTTVGDQIVPTKEAKAIAKFINNATGRGDLGSLNKMTNELNLLLWSPRMISSRINMFANPKIYIDLPKGMRREGLKSLLGIASMGTMVNTLAALGGAKVGTNILSSDFGKSRFGSKVIDPNAGVQQYVVGAARFLMGKTDSTAPTNRLEIAGRFLANKESPAASLANTILTGKKFSGLDFTTQYGEKTNIQSQVAKQFIPIFIQDLNDLMTTEPQWSDNIGLTAAMGAASLAGMAQDYPEKKPAGLQLRKLTAK